MTPPPRPGPPGFQLRRVAPEIKELTIQLGDADLYIHMGRKVELGNGHILYEAVLTDAHGSRAIYIDYDDIVATLQETFPASGAPASPPAAPEDAPRRRPGS